MYQRQVMISSLFQFAFAISLISKVISETGPVFLKFQEQNVEFLNTQGAKLVCNAHGDPIPEVKWYRSSEYGQKYLVQNDMRLISVHRNGNLEFMKFDEEEFDQNIHASIYNCVATNRHGSITSLPISVRATTMLQQQQLQALVYDEYVINGNTAVLKCNIPTFFKDDLQIVSWIREDNLVIDRTTKHNLMRITWNGNLHIENVSKYMNLKLGYWCRVKNKITNETSLSQTAGRIIINEPRSAISPIITDIPDKIIVKRGASALLTCAAQGLPPPKFQWKSKSNRRVISTKSYHTLAQLRKSGKFVYDCIAQNSFGSDSKEIQVIVQDELSASITPSSQIISSDEDVDLECKIEGHPVNSIVWYFNGKLLEKETGPILEIKSVSQKHEGMYQCIVSNDISVAQTATQIILGDIGPAFVKVFDSIIMQPGPTISLTCAVNGRPTPQLSWKKNEKIIKKSTKYTIEEKKLKNGTIINNLIVKNVKRNDGGEYLCFAQNNISLISHTGSLRVYGLPYVHQMKNISVAAGESIVIRCFVGGYPIRTIKWMRGNDNKYMSVNSQDFRNGTLLIRDIRNEDEGEYKCIAKNGQGQEASGRLWLEVIAKPELIPINLPPTLRKGNSLTLTCSILSGDGPLTLTWTKDGQALKLEQNLDVTMTKTFSVLQIQKLKEDHSGNYSCTATNLGGSSIQSVVIKVSVSPKWRIQPVDAFAEKGSTKFIDCQASGHPTPVTNWYKILDEKYKLLTNGSDIIIYKNGSMMMKNIQESYSGKYRCVASNGIPSNLIVEIFLEVGKKPSILKLEKNITSNSSVEFICEVIESTNITWILNGKKRLNISDKRVNFKSEGLVNKSYLKFDLNTTFRLNEVACLASNKFGSSRIKRRFDFALSTPSPGLNKLSTKTISLTDKKSIITVTSLPIKNMKSSTKNLLKTTEPSMKDQIVFKKNNEKLQIKDEGYKKHEKNSIEQDNLLKSSIIYILPSASVVILLLAILITVLVYILTRKRNRSNASHNQIYDRRNDEHYKLYANSVTTNSTIDKRYYNTVPHQNRVKSGAESPIYSNYEIPDYYSNLQPYATLQLASRDIPLSEFRRNSQASV